VSDMPLELFRYIIPHEDNIDIVQDVTPLAELEEYIDHIYLFSGVDKLFSNIVFSDGSPMIAIMEDKNGYVEFSNKKKLSKIYSAWFCSQIVENTHVNDFLVGTYLIVIKFNILNFYKLFGITPIQLRKHNIGELSILLGLNSSLLIDKIYEFESIENRLKIFQKFLIENMVISNLSKNALLSEAISIIIKEKGSSPIAGLISKLSVNYKWIERNFVSGTGIKPKEFAQMHRFLNAYVDMANNSLVDQHYLALKNGFYDQNHFIKCFKDFTSMTPKKSFSTR
jgi:AraC-like DNA-binding protein